MGHVYFAQEIYILTAYSHGERFHRFLYTSPRFEKNARKVCIMDEARRKLRLWLAFVVAAAVIIGLVYYFTDGKNSGDKSEGTLVMTEEVTLSQQKKEQTFEQVRYDRSYLKQSDMERAA